MLLTGVVLGEDIDTVCKAAGVTSASDTVDGGTGAGARAGVTFIIARGAMKDGGMVEPDGVALYGYPP